MCWKNVLETTLGNKYNTSAIIRIYHLEVGRLVHIFHNFPTFSREVLSTSRSSLGHRIVIFEKIQGFFSDPTISQLWRRINLDSIYSPKFMVSGVSWGIHARVPRSISVCDLCTSLQFQKPVRLFTEINLRQ